MKRIALIIVAASLAACGADGEPLRPTANVGVSIGSGGVTPTAGVGASNGTFTIGLGF